MTALERNKGKDLRGQQVFLRPEESSAPALTTRQSTTLSEQLQDALLRLAAVVDARSLRVALRDSIQELLPSTECVCVYTLEGDSRLLSDDPPHELPQEGKIRSIVGQLKRCQCTGLPSPELPEKYRACLAAPLPAHRRAVVIPVLDHEQDKAIAVLLVSCNPLTDQDELHLNMLERHASVACGRIQAIQASYQRPPLSPSPIQSHNALLHLNVSEQDYCELDRNILQLCGELYDLDAASLQLKVINYVSGWNHWFALTHIHTGLKHEVHANPEIFPGDFCPSSCHYAYHKLFITQLHHQSSRSVPPIHAYDTLFKKMGSRRRGVD